MYEGGIRVPMIAKWPGKIKAGSSTDHVSGFEDILPTCMDLSGGATPDGLSGLSILPTLLGEGDQEEHDHMYWELGRRQAIRVGDWKLVRTWPQKGDPKIELFNLRDDRNEEHDLKEDRPIMARFLAKKMVEVRTVSPEFRAPQDVLHGVT
jgi:arylsulfatase A-like enzyme